jgi:uncharacterized protein YfaP (DUF2135 family)
MIKFLLLLCTLPLWAGETSISVPKSGWRNSSAKVMSVDQPVHYPAVSTTVKENQSEYALIKGKINNMPKDKPGTLIVNGVSMPLLVDENGAFGRPYLFGYGSNNVEVRDASGKNRKRVQFFEANKLSKQSRLSILMSWDSDSTDLDLHVISPDGEHTYYGQKSAKNGGSLDVDVTTGYGPEIYSSPAPLSGRYLVYANYYGSGNDSDITVVNITVITNQNSADEKVETKVTSMRTPGEINFITSFDVK